MYATLWLVLLLVSCCAGDPCQKMCEYKDVECILKGADIQYKSIVDGVDGDLPTLDPLLIDKLDGDTTLSNIQFTGLRDCSVSMLSLDPSVKSYDYHVHCPMVVIEFNYLNERIKATSYDFDQFHIGTYGLIQREDKKRHFYIKYRNSTRMDYKEFKSVQTPLDDGEPALLPEETIKSLVSLISNKAMDVIMEYINTHLSKYNALEVFPDC